MHSPSWATGSSFQAWLDALRSQGAKCLAALLDPDKLAPAEVPARVQALQQRGVGLVLVGGSLLARNATEAVVQAAKATAQVPVVLFPGSLFQLCPQADALLFLSLISGRNPELLIGHHVHSAPVIHEMGLEPVPTGYMLVDCGTPTTASYISGTTPLPHHKPQVAAATALAGQMLGLRALYLDGGSGATQPVSAQMVAAVRACTHLPLLVGGGIRTQAQAQAAWHAGADVVVVGTALEEAEEAFWGPQR